MKNVTNIEKNSANSPNLKVNFWVNWTTNLKTLFTLPKWFKIFLIVLSVVAVAGVIGSFALMSWANGKVETANLTFNGIDRGNKEVKANENAYSARVHFKRLDVLLRSKVIAYIDIKSISWVSQLDSNAVREIKSQNRYIKFISTQNLQALNTQNLGEVQFKMDFSPLLKTIVKYYCGILVLMLLGLGIQNLIKLGKIKFYHIAYALVAFGIVVRIYQYIFHKDLWLDEAYIAYPLYSLPWSELFFAPLSGDNGSPQSVPLLFLLFSKFLGGIFGYGEHTLYFLPCVFGIATLILAIKIAKLLFGDKTMGFLAFIVLVCGSLGLLYYSAEFKQYGIEAFCGFLLIYCYLKNLAFKRFIAVSVLCFLASHTGIFVAFACIAGYFYKTFSKPFILKAWIKNNSTFILLSAFLALLFIAYYFAYVRYQAVSGFYDYWKQWLIPLNPLELPSFFVKILPVYSGFTPFDKGNVIPLYMLVSCVGLLWLWQNKRDMFVVCVGILVIYVGLSVCQTYPFGHDGVMGGRLSLFMSVFFYMMCASGANYLYEKINFKWCKVLFVVCLLGFALFGAYKNAQKFLPKYRHAQQTHDFITQIAKEYEQSNLPDLVKCVFVYRSANPAFLYYSHIDNISIPHKIFDKEFNEQNSNAKFGDSSCQKMWILASHYPPIANWVNLLITHAKSLSENATIEMAKTGWGSILIRLEK